MVSAPLFAAAERGKQRQPQQFLLAGAFGFAGNSSASGGGNKSEADLASGLGFYLGNLGRVNRNLALGGTVGMTSWRADSLPVDRSYMIDFDFLMRVRFPILPLNDKHDALVAYVGMRTGFTLSILAVKDAAPLEANIGFGFNLSPVGGLNYNFVDTMGIFLEMGYGLHMAWHQLRSAGSEYTGRIANGEFALNFGLNFLY
ncbi:MAG: hypothetical protein KC492_03780 [Myxococcales bacterium]|nr:hypothetical protein [Myxococcales bacterium]